MALIKLCKAPLNAFCLKDRDDAFHIPGSLRYKFVVSLVPEIVVAIADNERLAAVYELLRQQDSACRTLCDVVYYDNPYFRGKNFPQLFIQLVLVSMLLADDKYQVRRLYKRQRVNSPLDHGLAQDFNQRLRGRDSLFSKPRTKAGSWYN